MIPFKLRVAAVQDVKFILSSWLATYQPYVHSSAPVASQDYFAQQKKNIMFLLVTSNYMVVACDPEDETFILSYLIGTHLGENKELILHWGATRKTAQNQGLFHEIMSKLPPDTTNYFTHAAGMHKPSGKTRWEHYLNQKITYSPWRGFPQVPPNFAQIEKELLG
jgi:hypothetical protein